MHEQPGHEQPGRPTLMDLDLSENPLGTPPSVVRALRQEVADLHRYPRGVHERAVEAVAAHLGVSPAAVLVTAAFDEALDLLFAEVRSALCFEPGFPACRHRADAMRIGLTTMRLNHAWLPPPVGRWAVRTDLVVITQPNNPTGNLFPRPWVEDLVAVAPLVLVDETYIDFSDAPSLVGTSRSNVCVFRSFSKAYGLAGARVGCLVGSPSLIGRLRERQRFFSVDRISLRAAIAVLEDPDFLKQTVSHVRELRPRYTAMLRSHPRLFQRVAETQCNFVLAQCTASTEVNALLTDLLGLGIRLADLRPLQLPGWVRIGIGGAGELDDVDDVLTTIEAALAPAAPDDQLTHAP